MFLEISQNSQENCLCQSLFFNKVAGLVLQKKGLWHRCFLWILRNFTEPLSLQKTSGGCFCNRTPPIRDENSSSSVAPKDVLRMWFIFLWETSRCYVCMWERRKCLKENICKLNVVVSIKWKKAWLILRLRHGFFSRITFYVALAAFLSYSKLLLPKFENLPMCHPREKNMSKSND